ncbi:MAG: hypothetical protein JWL62_2643 [Hyphomicrobiales bacterium]|nr:hypothetical protein [Hyphomicrobiales bacterium]
MTGSTFDFDLVILGGGIACTLTLSAFLSTLEAGEGTVSIAVIEKDAQFWRGLPYGRRSSPNSLIITALSEFVPDEERAEFIAWLIAERQRWTAELRSSGGDAAAHWLNENDAAMSAGEWTEIYVPRILFGDFAEAKLARTIAQAEQDGLAKVTLVHGEAIDVELSAGHYNVSLLQDGVFSSIEARTVLLAIGSPPFKPLAGAAQASSFYVNDAYSPSLPENLSALRSHMQSIPRDSGRNLLIVGSNATALEALYMISRNHDLRETLDNIVVLSTGGSLPRMMTRERFRQHSFPRVEALRRADNFTAKDIVVAAELDVAAIAASTHVVGDTFHHLSDLVVELNAKLDAAGQEEFHRVYGMRFTRLVRRAGVEYTEAAEDLVANGKLELLRGRFKSIDAGALPGKARLIYETDERSDDLVHSLDFAAVINCAGFEVLSANSSSPLIANLVRHKLAVPNHTGRGFDVDATFQTSPNVFVCGPMLAGVFNSSAKFWHVENVRRIHGLAQMIARSIVICVFGERAASRSPAPHPAELSDSLRSTESHIATAG